MSTTSFSMIDLRVFEAMPSNSILLATDAPRFTILAVTNGMIRQSGLSKTQLVNKPFFDPFPANLANPDDPNKTVQHLMYDSFNQVITTKAQHELPLIRYDLEDKNGIFTERYWKVFNQPVTDEQGKVLYILHSSEDITAILKTQQREERVSIIEKEQELFKKSRQSLKESHQRFEAAIAAVQGILWTNNAEGQMVGKQTGWSTLTGQSFEEYQGVGWTHALHPDDAQATLDAWTKAVKERRTFTYEHRVRKKEGGYGVFSIRAIPVLNEDGEVREWVGVHTDITEQQKADQQLRESETRFRALADDSPIFVFIIEPDANASVNYWNKTWLDYTGQSLEQAIGRAWDGIIHPQDLSVVMHYYAPAFENKESYFIPAVRVKRQDGEYRWHAFKGNPRYKNGREFNGFVGVGFDIHEQKLAEDALQESKARALLAIDAAKLGTFEIDIAGQTMQTSERAVEIFGFEHGSHQTYQDFIGVIHPDDVPLRTRAHEQAKQTGELVFETRIINPAGQIKHIRVNGKYLRDRSSPLLIGTIIDITEEKEAAKVLERKIEERTHEFKMVNEQLKQFTYSASHDLKEPLRKISVYIDKLIVGLGPRLSDSNKNIAERIVQTTDRMRTLIDDLLAYSNTTLGATEYQPVNLHEMVTAVMDDIEIQVAEKAGKIHLENLPVVNGDPRQLRQLFQNLIGNALKYSKKEVAPEIYISSSLMKNAGVLPGLPAREYIYEIQVKDNGIGFDPSDAQRIFGLFQRLHGRTAYEGTGVGLAIVQKVVENHKGLIIAEAALGQGAVFKVYLPVFFQEEMTAL